MQYIIDRITEGLAICEREDGTFEEIPIAQLPQGARAGNVLQHEGGTWVLDLEAEQERRRRLFGKQEGLFH